MIDIQGKSVWIKDEQRAAKLNVSQVLPDNEEEDNRTIIKLLRSMRQFNTGGPLGVMITEALKLNDERSWSPQFEEAKQKEIVGLSGKGVFEIVLKEDVPKEASVLRGRFILAIENLETNM